MKPFPSSDPAIETSSACSSSNRNNDYADAVASLQKLATILRRKPRTYSFVSTLLLSEIIRSQATAGIPWESVCLTWYHDDSPTH